MWVHIIVFIVISAFAVGWKKGWIPLGENNSGKGKRLFLLVAFCGNILGLILTVKNGNVQLEDLRLKKEETGAYEEKMIVSVEGEESASLYIQIPAKEMSGEESGKTESVFSAEEEKKKELQDVISRYNQEKNDPDYYYLPQEWEGKRLEWEKPADTSGTLFASLCLAAGIALMILTEREGQAKELKRREQMLMDYPGLIMKFTLLVQAGMTARKAFQKIAADYSRRSDGQKRYAYEEIKAICYEMDSGISEGEAYRRLEERCGQVKYKTFATLLIQNLQKGSRHLADMLERESMEAWEERKRKARVLGEAAATKLLVPMVLMLLVVMAVIMIPACLTFYSGA